MSTPSYLRYANQGATRNQPLDPRLVSALGYLGDMGILAEVYSGGQPGKGSGGKRVGSTRHDHGNAGDFRFYRDGRQLDWARESDRPVFEEIVSRGRAAGITGFGAGPGYMGAGTMHVGFGSPGVWGADGRSANAPDWLRNAYGGGSAPASGATSAIESAMLEGGPRMETASSTSNAPIGDTGGSMASRPMLNIGPEKSNRLAEAMLAQAMGGGDVSHPFELAGRLAQVYAGQRQIKQNDAANADALEQALAGSGLDPSYALAAQLGGDRDALAGAILSQQQDRAQAANRAEDRAWQERQFDYRAERDQVSDQQFAQRMAADQAAAVAKGSAGPEYGLTPQTGVDANGNPVLIQLAKDGTSIQTPMPDGVSLSKEPIRLDAGTHFVLLDPITRQPVGQIPKENRAAAAETAGGTVEGRTAAERQATAGADEQAAQNSLDLIESIRNDPSRSRGTGMSSVFNRVPGTGGFDFQQKVEQAKGGAFLAAVQQMRGLGALSNNEGTAATAAITRMNTSASEEGFLEALADYEKIIQQGLDRARGNQAPAAAVPARGPMPMGSPENPVQLDTVTVPSGVDPADWEFMSDEEKALFR